MYLVHKLEPQKGIPQCGSPGGPAGTGGRGTNNSECGTGWESRKESAFPQISYSSHYLQVLTENFDLNLTQILGIKFIQYLKTRI